MALDFLAEGLGRITDLWKKDAPPLNPSDFPQTPRKYPLLYCLVYTGKLTQSDIKALAQQFYQDTLSGSIHSLREVVEQAGLHAARGWNTGFIDRTDNYLDRVALSFSNEEMERQHSTRVRPNEIPPSGIDTLAGSGPPRPLIKRLYSLDVDRLALAQASQQGDNFTPTRRGISLADAMEKVYSNKSWPEGQLVVFGPNGHYIGTKTPKTTPIR